LTPSTDWRWVSASLATALALVLAWVAAVAELARPPANWAE
jgi:hypothetical protein